MLLGKDTNKCRFYHEKKRPAFPEALRMVEKRGKGGRDGFSKGPSLAGQQGFQDLGSGGRDEK